MARLLRRGTAPTEISLFCAALACFYVAGRLWSTTRSLHHLEKELQASTAAQQYLLSTRPKCSSSAQAVSAPVAQSTTPPDSNSDVIHYSVRYLSGNTAESELPTLRGNLLEEIQASTADRNPNLLGAVDGIEAGEAFGWACFRNAPWRPLQVTVYVDGVKIGVTSTSTPTPHLLISRMCEGETSETESTASAMLGWQQRLPLLAPGRHKVQAFVRSIDKNSSEGADNQQGQELNQSPLPFIEARQLSAPQQSMARKDEIIRVRNAQVSQLWDDLHLRHPWRNVLSGNNTTLAGFDGQTKNPPLLAVIAINTGFASIAGRSLLRSTWVPQGVHLRDLEQKSGIVIRFVIGRSDQADDAMERKVQAEMKKYKDILRVDSTDTYADLASKTLKLFSQLPDKYDASFYFKVDDDVLINLPSLETYLIEKRNEGNLYLGCMKSGPVLTDSKYKWYEPDSWRFGDGQNGGHAQYMRHASGQFYGVSAPIARWISRNADILHKYANEDITVGTWLMGLNVNFHHESRMCCINEQHCNKQNTKGEDCLGFYEMACHGMCNPDKRLPELHKACVLDHTADHPGPLADLVNRMNKKG